SDSAHHPTQSRKLINPKLINPKHCENVKLKYVKKISRNKNLSRFISPNRKNLEELQAERKQLEDQMSHPTFSMLLLHEMGIITRRYQDLVKKIEVYEEEWLRVTETLEAIIDRFE
ncbi:MAG: hypothetical protein PHE86_06440, partial [Candidatus Marinimicrobia bacterium]|nr:hypothetical protein [Candidatus Neomarinimicrobiota bacterium]